ncbi:hypothetical protein C1752_08479 [Acaryochloris thomasi RCC1774]|uniref:Uncharacterized protein n=1 Tax=Acaryochloris thomasi RCC1774 TaxID=1764569 RepID=A0A2W1JQ52_9CYAN|nr:hypothetical protein [Acaryochloris thomasi]PZD71037.1 hypothetical protein C1752_08479 [Acaryochloris thomasi RCC1774]
MSGNKILDGMKGSRKRGRPKVSRDTSFTAQDHESASNTSAIPNATEENQITRTLSWEEELKTLPEVGNRRNIRLETSIDEELFTMCRDSPLTLETLLEGFYIVCKDNPKLMKKVQEEAESRYKQRKRKGQLRRLISQA